MPKSINKKTSKRVKPKRTIEDNPLKPINIDKELEGVDNFLIKVIVFVETFILNTFIYSIKLVTDLPKLLAYLTPVDRHRVTKSSFIMSIIYNILHLLSSIFGFRISFIPRPVFHRYTAITTLLITPLLLILSIKYKNKYILENPQEEEEYEEDEYVEGYPPNEDNEDINQNRASNNFTRKENIVEANTWNDEEEYEEEWGDNRLPKEPIQTIKKEYKTMPKQSRNTPKEPVTINNKTSETPPLKKESINSIKTKESFFTEQVDKHSPFTESESDNTSGQTPSEDYNINIMNLLTGSGIDISVNNTEDDDDEIELLFDDNIL